MCCSVLQCVAACCSVLQCVTVFGLFQRPTTNCLRNLLRCVDLRLFCRNIRILCGDIGLFCRDAGLFGGDTRLFCRDTGLFCGDVRLFCGDTGLFCGEIGLFCGDEMFFFKMRWPHLITHQMQPSSFRFLFGVLCGFIWISTRVSISFLKGYRVATIRRLLKIISLFYRISSLL